MAEQLIEELEKAARVVLAPSNFISNEERRTAEKVFLNFRKTKTPYQLCRQILETNTNDYILFEAAGLIRIALLREWSALSKEDVSSLRQYLLHYVINRPYLAQYVKTCILQVVAIMIKRSSINDSGQERQQILSEIENLIMTGDLPKKVVGWDLIFAIMQEYTTMLKSSDIGLTLQTHLKEKERFQADLKRILKFCVNMLDELMKKDMQEDTVTILKHLLPVIEGIFTWMFVKNLDGSNELELAFYFLLNKEGQLSPLELGKDWQDIILLPSVLDLMFTLYWKIRGNPQLAHHARTCLVQLASMNGLIVSAEEVKLQYLSNYLQRFLKFITNIDIIDQEASGIATIIKNLFTFYDSVFKLLPKDILKLFMDQLSRLTCMFIENTVQEDSSCNDCLYTEALNILFQIWIRILSENSFPFECCKETYAQIFNIYLQCHLFVPEGKRSIEEKNLDKEDIGVEEDDKVKYKEQLQTIGSIGRQVPEHSLPLLARLIDDRSSKLRENLNKIAGHVETPNTMSSVMNRLYEDIHWLLLVSGHVLCMESVGEIALIPSEIMAYSIKQVSQGKIDINLTLQLLTSSENVSSDMNVPIELVDHVVLLAAYVFRLCTIEKTAISVHLDSILSPELSCTITWFLCRWCLNYLLLKNYSETSITFEVAFGEDTPGALWATNFLFGKIEYNINTFKSELVLMEETIKLLLSLVRSAKQVAYKYERFGSIIELATKGRYDLPQIVKRGLMQAITQVGDAVQYREPNYWLHTLQPLHDRCKRIISNEKFLQSYHQEELKVEIIDILECFIGVVQGVQYSTFKSLFPHVYAMLQELPKLLSLYHNYQEIVELILKLLCECVKGPLFHVEDSNVLIPVYKIYVDTIQNYGHYNTNRLTTDSTAEEDMYQDILLLIELLTNIQLTSTMQIDVFLCGLNIIVPMVTTGLLKFPTVCLRYFEMIQRFCSVKPKKIFNLRPELLQPLLASVELGLFSFGYEVSELCCTIIRSLVRDILETDVPRGQSPNQLMAPFLNSLLNLILSHQIDANSIANICEPFYCLMCCYQDKYQQLVENIISSQSDQQIAQSLGNAFAKLNQGVEFDPNCVLQRSWLRKFKNHFEEFVFTVWGFSTVK